MTTHLADGSKAVRDVREGRLEVKVAREAYVLLGMGGPTTGRKGWSQEWALTRKENQEKACVRHSKISRTATQ